MAIRVIVGLLIGIVLILAVITHWIAFAVLVLAVAIIAVYEMDRTFRAKGIKLTVGLLYAYCVLLLPASYFLSTNVIAVLLFTISLLIMSYGIFRKNVSVNDIFCSLATLIYPNLPITFIFLSTKIQQDAMRQFVVLTACACTYLSDTFALFGGTLFGKHKLCERISPKKTIEGAICGIIGAVVGGFIMKILGFHVWGISIAWYHMTIVAVMCSILGVAGDLFASLIKRFAGVKDFGNLLPGHGGILDRIDSLLFPFPVVFIYFYELIIVVK